MDKATIKIGRTWGSGVYVGCLFVLGFVLPGCFYDHWESCDEVLDQVKAYSLDLHQHDWEPFRAIAEGSIGTADPADDFDFCLDLATEWDVGVRYSDIVRGASLFSVVLLTSDFDDLSIKDQAEIFCHEMQHIGMQRRMGVSTFMELWLDDAGLLAIEVTAYAMSSRLRRRYGRTKKSDAKVQKERARRFPEDYSVDLRPECIDAALGWASAEHLVWLGGLQ